MKRGRSACILQTLVFSQKPELELSADRARQLNREEFENYKHTLEKTKTRYIIVNEAEQADGAIVIHVKKQYNDKTDVSEYFN